MSPITRTGQYFVSVQTPDPFFAEKVMERVTLGDDQTSSGDAVVMGAWFDPTDNTAYAGAFPFMSVKWLDEANDLVPDDRTFRRIDSIGSAMFIHGGVALIAPLEIDNTPDFYEGMSSPYVEAEFESPENAQTARSMYEMYFAPESI